MEVKVSKSILIQLDEKEAAHLKDFIGRKNEPTIVNGTIFHDGNDRFNAMSELYLLLGNEINKLQED